MQTYRFKRRTQHSSPKQVPRAAARLVFVCLAGLALLACTGCGLSKGPGVVPASNFGPSMAIDELVRRSAEFNVFVFTGPRPSLMLFDPKDDAWSFRILDQPVLFIKQPTNPVVIDDYADDLQDRLYYPKKYVQAITVRDQTGQEMPAGYVYLANPSQISMRYDQNDPHTVVVVKVLELERFVRDLIHEDD